MFFLVAMECSLMILISTPPPPSWLCGKPEWNILQPGDSNES